VHIGTLIPDADVVAVAAQIGPFICCLKTHIDILVCRGAHRCQRRLWRYSRRGPDGLLPGDGDGAATACEEARVGSCGLAFSQCSSGRSLTADRSRSFLIFEDRKYADIGNTVSMQYASVWGPTRIGSAAMSAGAGRVQDGHLGRHRQCAHDGRPRHRRRFVRKCFSCPRSHSASLRVGRPPQGGREARTRPSAAGRNEHCRRPHQG
jgi:hypothetical protein